MMRTAIELSTDRLLLRELTLDDAPAINRHASRKEIAATTASIPHPYPAGAAEMFIEHTHERRESGKGVILGIILRESDELVGTIGLAIEPEDHRAELGYWVGVDHWGRGIATEAGRAMLAFGFDDLDLHRIHACFYPHNPTSGRVLFKLGMVEEGRLREHKAKDGRMLDMVLMGVLREQWQSGAADS